MKWGCIHVGTAWSHFRRGSWSKPWLLGLVLPVWGTAPRVQTQSWERCGTKPHHCQQCFKLSVNNFGAVKSKLQLLLQWQINFQVVLLGNWAGSCLHHPGNVGSSSFPWAWAAASQLESGSDLGGVVALLINLLIDYIQHIIPFICWITYKQIKFAFLKVRIDLSQEDLIKGFAQWWVLISILPNLPIALLGACMTAVGVSAGNWAVLGWARRIFVLQRQD